MGRRTKKKPQPVAVLTEDERIDYATRMALLNTKKAELAAAAHYLDQLGEDFKEKYELPHAYNLDLSTGEIHSAELEVVDG